MTTQQEERWRENDFLRFQRDNHMPKLSLSEELRAIPTEQQAKAMLEGVKETDREVFQDEPKQVKP